MRTISVKNVPYVFNDEQKQHRLNICFVFQGKPGQNYRFFKKVVTIGEILCI
jgi:hypothetical protein